MARNPAAPGASGTVAGAGNPGVARRSAPCRRAAVQAVSGGDAGERSDLHRPQRSLARGPFRCLGRGDPPAGGALEPRPSARRRNALGETGEGRFGARGDDDLREPGFGKEGGGSAGRRRGSQAGRVESGPGGQAVPWRSRQRSRLLGPASTWQPTVGSTRSLRGVPTFSSPPVGIGMAGWKLLRSPP